ncbi:MAG: hypothetical protein ABR907_17125 [Terracidiphilus sp.]
MLIHRGRGALVLVITFACLFITELCTRIYFHDNSYYQTHKWPILLGFFAAAAIVQLLIQRKPRVSSLRKQEYLVSSSIDFDPDGQDMEIAAANWRIFRNIDSVFGIPVRFWPWILFALGFLLSFLPATALE